jgi:hypothetical protein
VIRRLRALLAKHQSEREPFDLGLAISDVAKLLEAEADRRQATSRLQPVQSTAMVIGDAVQIQQVFINLILNAMDAVADVPQHRRAVTLEVEAAAATIIVTVRDRGRGIAPEHLPKVFDSFSTKHRGMGLGLSIAPPSSKLTVAASGPTTVASVGRCGSGSSCPLRVGWVPPQQVRHDPSRAHPCRRRRRFVSHRVARAAGGSGEAGEARGYASTGALLDPTLNGPGCLLLDVRSQALGPTCRRPDAPEQVIPIVFLTGHADVPTGIRCDEVRRGGFLGEADRA